MLLIECANGYYGKALSRCDHMRQHLEDTAPFKLTLVTCTLSIYTYLL